MRTTHRRYRRDHQQKSLICNSTGSSPGWLDAAVVMGNPLGRVSSSCPFPSALPGSGVDARRPVETAMIGRPPWNEVLGAALLLRDFLRDRGLDTVVKTSGGKGLHIMLQLKPKHDWSIMKPFSKAVASAVAAEVQPALPLGVYGRDPERPSRCRSTGLNCQSWPRPGSPFMNLPNTRMNGSVFELTRFQYPCSATWGSLEATNVELFA